jgi:hypothetical protein
MKSRSFLLMVVCLMMFTVCFSGCIMDDIDEAMGNAVTDRQKQTFDFKCAWCGRAIATYTYETEVFPTINGYRTVFYRTDPLGGRTAIWSTYGANDQAHSHKNDAFYAANNVIAEDAAKLAPHGGYKTDEATFCSLKCVNAYAASKDIKEERLRIITGE